MNGESWVRSKADELAVDQGCTFDLRAADRVRIFLGKFCRHSKGEWAGKPLELLDWQWRDVIAPLFGWKRANGTRRFRRAGVWVPKKNGKSTMVSGLCLYMLVGDQEPGAEVYCAAADREQAGIVYTEAANMVEASPELQKRLDVVRSTKRIVYPSQAAFMKTLSADVKTKAGLNWNFCEEDEIHAWPGAPTSAMHDALQYGGAARRQPLLMSISTAGSDKTSFGYERYNYAKQVLEGKSVDLEFFPYIAEAAVEDDWKSEAIWRKANPSLGFTIKLDDLAGACREAVNSPVKENSFRRDRLNQWTDADVRWIASDRWDACDLPLPESLVGLECYGGLDLSSTRDTTSLVLLFPHEDTSWSVRLFCWVPENTCRERERTNRTRFDWWVHEGWMEKTPGDVVDYSRVRKRIKAAAEMYQIKEIAFDPWNATDLVTQLLGDGFPMIEFGQGFASMSSPAKELEKLIFNRRIRHGGNPVLKWMIGNTVVETDAAENIKPSKKKSTEKIDGVVSLVMALGRAMVRPELQSVYDDRGLEVL